MKVILVGCGSQKLREPSQAQHLYTGNLFRLSWQYAEMLEPDARHIISGLYHLLNPEEIVSSYQFNLNKQPIAVRREWANNVVGQLNELYNLQEDEFILLAGAKYVEYIVPHLTNHELPLEGMNQGQRLQFLSNAVNG